MVDYDDEEKRVRSVAFQNAHAILLARERTERELMAERERLRITLASIGDAVICTDADGRITFLNVVAEALTGWTQAQAAGRLLPEVFRVVNEQTRLPVENPAERALREGVVVGLANHTVLVARDGTERPIDDSAAPILDSAGTRLGAVLVFRDITERRRTDETRARLAAIVESSDDAIVSKTLDGVIRSWNRGAERIFGYSAAEAVGQPITLIIPPELVDEERSILERLRRGERIDHFETVRMAKDGRRLNISLTVSPIRDSLGNVVGASKVARDITDRKRAEQVLRAAEERAEFARRVSGVGFWYCDLPFDVLQWDELVKEHFHLPPNAHVTIDTFWARIHPDDREPTRAAIERTIAERIPYDVHYRTLDPDTGAEKWIRAIGRASHAPDGRPVRFDGVTLDVTEQKRAEEALREADRKKDEFLALLAHELRNPLAPIRNGLQVIRMSDDTKVRDRSQRMMDRQLTHMVRLVDDLLDVSRISRNKLELRRARVPLSEVVASAVETARPLIDDAGHELTISLPAAAVYLDADLTRLAQVFSNLLTNSAKYTPSGGRIWLSAERVGGGVVVSVRDTGIGIPTESLTQIFDMFSQVDRSVEKNTGGLGIGLALVKGLVEMHGGTVTAASDGPGKGSNFTVTLPVPEGHAVPVGVAPRTGLAPAPRRRVLVVDDNRDGAESMAEMLGLLGSEVRTAHDGIEAIEAAGQFRPELILMDVGMPRLNGLDATRRIREAPWSRDVVIVALTGWGQEADRERSKEAGCDAHLVKPVDVAELQQLLTGLRRATNSS
jgi:PAS domain S-box-containing protein